MTTQRGRRASTSAMHLIMANQTSRIINPKSKTCHQLDTMAKLVWRTSGGAQLGAHAQPSPRSLAPDRNCQPRGPASRKIRLPPMLRAWLLTSAGLGIGDGRAPSWNAKPGLSAHPPFESTSSRPYCSADQGSLLGRLRAF